MSGDLFGENRVLIPGNKPLQQACNRIMEVVNGEGGSELLKGDSVGDIDRRVRVAVWLASGLRGIVPEENIPAFMEWAADHNRCMDTELLRRARQWLVQYDHIRLSAAAVKDAEQMRQRLTGAFRK